MDKKIFLDSGVMISLGKIHKFCNGDVNKLSQRKEVLKTLQEDSINIIDKDVDNLCKLYAGVVKKDVMACVPPFVYKEISMDATNPSSKLTTQFFHNTNCFLAMPDFDKSSDLLFSLKTQIYAQGLESVDVVDSSNPEIRYGLAPDVHTYTGKEPVDVNNEDRWLVSQVQALSELGDENIKFIPGKAVLWDKVSIDKSIEKMYEEVEMVRDNLEFALDFAKNALKHTDDEIYKQDIKNMYLFLQENEKDYGREIVADRTRTFAVKNESACRDVKAMASVLKQINEKLSGVRVVSPTGKELSQMLGASSSKNMELNEQGMSM